MLAVVGLFREPQVEWKIAGLVTETHVVLALAGSLVAGTMFVATVLSSTSFCLKY